MSRPIVVVDIETRPDQAILDDAAYWSQRAQEIQAPANYKDQVKIENWKTEALAKERAGLALVSHTGRIAAVGACLLDSDELPMVQHADDVSADWEALLLGYLHGAISKLAAKDPMYVVAGWNIRDFDMPFLAGRALVLGLTMPSRFPKPKDWVRVLDGCDLLDGTLSDWMRAVGLPPKKVEGADTLHLPLPELGVHCSDDLVATRVVLRRLVAAYPGLMVGADR
jgi:hypothetical protein